jgi:dTDP-4-amino-4,6-dideoxygalactose transaminase
MTKTNYRVPFNRPGVVGTELGYMSSSVGQRSIGGDGPFTRACRGLLEECLGVPRVLLTTSCTDALEMSALLLDLQPGDEVIMPSFTFVSTANAFALRGARPVFADVRPDTLNMNESGIEALITARTKAIVPVHYAGVGCDMEAIGAIAREHGLTIVEDNAHGLFGRFRGRPLGTFGSLATLSFHETKNFTCGEGGALLVNDPQLIGRAEILRDKGTNRARFYRGEVDKYSWVDVGSSFLPSDLLAAFLYAQLEAREDVQGRRRAIWNRYAEWLGPWAAAHAVQLPTVPADCEQAYHMFYLILPTAASRDAFIDHLKAAGILSVFHYVPLHLSEMGRRFGGREGDCPITEDRSARLVRLPFYNDLSDEDQQVVVDAVQAFRPA